MKPVHLERIEGLPAVPVKDFSSEIERNPLAVSIGASTINITKIQEIDDPVGTTFKVILVSGVTAFGNLTQYEEAMTKHLDYLALTHKKLLITMAQAEELEPLAPFVFDGENYQG